MDEDGIGSTFADRSGYLADGIVLDGENIDVCISVDFIGTKRVGTAQFFCQFLGMFLRTAIHLYDIFASGLQGEGEMCGEVARADENNAHVLMCCVK